VAEHVLIAADITPQIFARDHRGGGLNTIISVDVETTGPIPSDFSMIQLGAVAYSSEEENEIGIFDRVLKELPNASREATTMKFWKNEAPDIWSGIMRRIDKDVADPDPETVMKDFVKWVETFEHPSFMGYPATFDFGFVNWYIFHFVGYSPLSWSGQDLKTMISDVLDLPFRQSTKKRLPKEWLRGLPKHTHDAVDDARGQGQLFFRVRQTQRNLLRVRDKSQMAF
jgi:DNA polymerase III alpha subunit (gram-positive type)